MNCQRCNKPAVAFAQAKCSDLFYFRRPGGKEQNGYVLSHELSGLRADEVSSDYMAIYYCLACGQIQGEWPVKGGRKYMKNADEARLPVGKGFLCFQTVDGNRLGTNYVRLVDADDNELVYWDSAEWEEAPIYVMGAIMGALQALQAGLIAQVKAAKEE